MRRKPCPSQWAAQWEVPGSPAGTGNNLHGLQAHPPGAVRRRGLEDSGPGALACGIAASPGRGSPVPTAGWTLQQTRPRGVSLRPSDQPSLGNPPDSSPAAGFGHRGVGWGGEIRATTVTIESSRQHSKRPHTGEYHPHHMSSEDRKHKRPANPRALYLVGYKKECKLKQKTVFTSQMDTFALNREHSM